MDKRRKADTSATAATQIHEKRVQKDSGQLNTTYEDVLMQNAALLLANKLLKKSERDIRQLNTQLAHKVIKRTTQYAFISHINQSIVHTNNEATLFRKLCRTAVEVGRFKLAWIGLFDTTSKKMNVTAQNGIPKEDIALFTDVYCQNNEVQHQVLLTGTYYLCDNISCHPDFKKWQPFATKNRIRSFMVLPIRRLGIIVGTFNLYASEFNFFDKEEIALLMEVSGDISFALDLFEKEKKQKATEELIIVNEKRFRSLVENGTDAVAILSAEGSVIYISPSVEGILGYTEAEAMELDILSLMHPSDASSMAKVWEIVLQSRGIPVPGHTGRMLHKDGTWKWLEATITNMLHDPSINGIIDNFRDVTQAKASERQREFDKENLLHSQEKLKEAQALAHMGSWQLDFKTNLLQLSDESCRIFGVCNKDNQLTFAAWSKLVHSDDRSFVLKTIKASRDSLTDISYHHRIVRKDGTIRHIYSESKFVFDFNNSATGLYGIMQDITERKMAEEEREKNTADILSRNKDLEQFSYIVSHNLRSPVANIIGLSEALRVEDLDPKTKDEVMEGISDSVIKLDEVITDLNYILQTKQHVSHKEIVHFSKIAADIKTSIDKQVEKENALIVWDFAEADKMLTVKSYLHSIFYNLINNSLKYHQPDVAPLIEIKSRKQKNKILLIFKDNGIGIDLQHKGEQVFGMYKRFHPQISDGKGMGLYMVKTQVESIGGKIYIESQVNEGTTFTIEFTL
ncbi:MAG TPA: PAS domain S-box protein [Pedobacter sp.]|uniref:PAS domain S-box protein n=1 Tax=Pedobacter sp. TaxID=1411316 RepID=UPI002C87FDA9|nr:PAS domain S-box protein [Pedobacter sp.]HMI02125.1 PAS domain S-box protein [Pedobacter sp.]